MKNNLNLILIIFFSIYLFYDFKRKRNISKKIENFPPPRRLSREPLRIESGSRGTVGGPSRPPQPRIESGSRGTVSQERPPQPRIESGSRGTVSQERPPQPRIESGSRGTVSLPQRPTTSLPEEQYVVTEVMERPKESCANSARKGKTCPTGYVLTENALCPDPEKGCIDDDFKANGVCCSTGSGVSGPSTGGEVIAQTVSIPEPKMNCLFAFQNKSQSCPSGNSLRPNADKIECAGESCEISDFSNDGKCCRLHPFCSRSFTCPEGKTASSNRCLNFNCDNTNEEESNCCEELPKVKCNQIPSGFSCGTGKRAKSNAQNIAGSSYEWSETEYESKCCEGFLNVTCADKGSYTCGTGTTAKLNALDIVGSSHEWSETEYQSKCCEELPNVTCVDKGSYTCGTGKRAKLNARDIVGSSYEWSETEYQNTCCEDTPVQTTTSRLVRTDSVPETRARVVGTISNSPSTINTRSPKGGKFESATPSSDISKVKPIETRIPKPKDDFTSFSRLETKKGIRPLPTPQRIPRTTGRKFFRNNMLALKTKERLLKITATLLKIFDLEKYIERHNAFNKKINKTLKITDADGITYIKTIKKALNYTDLHQFYVNQIYYNKMKASTEKDLMDDIYDYLIYALYFHYSKKSDDILKFLKNFAEIYDLSYIKNKVEVSDAKKYIDDEKKFIPIYEKQKQSFIQEIKNYKLKTETNYGIDIDVPIVCAKNFYVNTQPYEYKESRTSNYDSKTGFYINELFNKNEYIWSSDIPENFKLGNTNDKPDDKITEIEDPREIAIFNGDVKVNGNIVKRDINKWFNNVSSVNKPEKSELFKKLSKTEKDKIDNNIRFCYEEGKQKVLDNIRYKRLVRTYIN